MNKDYFSTLQSRLSNYDGASTVFDEGNNFIVNILKILYGFQSIPKEQLPIINRDFFIKHENPYLPFYFALQTRKSRFSFKKLDQEFKAIQKHKKHPLYLLTMGLAYLYGFGTEKDLKLAYRFFLRGSKDNCHICSFYLAKLLMSGNETIGVKRDVKLALKKFQSASDAGLAMATYEIAFLHAIRESNTLKINVTLNYLDLVVVQSKQLRKTVFGNFAIQMYKHFNVRNKAVNRRQKEYWITFAYEHQAPASALILYFFYQEVKDEEENAYAQSIEYLFDAARTNHPVALFELGNEYLKGTYLPKNFTLALKHLQASATFGYARAYLYIASLYVTDKKRYDKKIVASYIDLEYERILESGNKKGKVTFPFKIRDYEITSKTHLYGYLYFELGNLLMAREIYEEALIYYNKALSNEFFSGTYIAIGDVLTEQTENIGSVDRKMHALKAFTNYYNAFNNNESIAYERMAKCFALGFGIDRDETKAEQYIFDYINAAKKNEIETLIDFYTAVSYEFNEGRLVSRNLHLANYYLDKALSLQKN